MGFYDENKCQPKNRSIKLNDLKQKMPEGDLEVVDARKQKSNDGQTEYPILVLEDITTGDKIDVMAWERDVTKCVQQWGGAQSPTEWGCVRLVLNTAKTRYEIVPASESATQEDVPSGRKVRVKV